MNSEFEESHATPGNGRDNQDTQESSRLAPTGIAGLDDILSGGLARSRLYVIEGVPGSGKTTLAAQFLMDGARRGEPVLYITLSETAEELRSVAASHGWSLDGVTIRELLGKYCSAHCATAKNISELKCDCGHPGC